jgi:hypothetical protein
MKMSWSYPLSISIKKGNFSKKIALNLLRMYENGGRYYFKKSIPPSVFLPVLDRLLV